MSDRDQRVECEHGDGFATFVCQHLKDGVACGYHCSDEEDDLWPDAWCDLCEAARVREGGWNEASEGELRVSVLCQHLYDEAKERNARIPPPLAPGVLELNEAAVRVLLDHAYAWTKERQATAHRKFDMGAHQRWDADYDTGRFTLGSPGHPAVLADLQVVGTFSQKSNSWLWSWDNQVMEPGLVREVARLRVLGEVRGIPLLKQAYQENVDEADGWERASLACYLLGHEAVYRAPMDHRFLFMILKHIRWAS
jgi:hypothetical protein